MQVNSQDSCGGQDRSTRRSKFAEHHFCKDMPRAVPSLASLLDDGEARKRRIARLSHERELARDAEVYRAELTDQLKRVERRLARMTSPDRAQTTSPPSGHLRLDAAAARILEDDGKERARRRMADRYAKLVSDGDKCVNAT